jgi:predicted transposase YdaD
MDAQQLTKPRELSRVQKHELWVQWLNDLPAHERHWIFIHCEMEWCDQFIDGDMPLASFQEVLHHQFDEFSVKV